MAKNRDGKPHSKAMKKAKPPALARRAATTISPRMRLRVPKTYPALLEDIKTRIRAAQVRAALSVNRELIELYWAIGRDIVLRQKEEAWGRWVVERLADDICTAIPGISGFSRQIFGRCASFIWGGPTKSQFSHSL